MKKYLTVEDVLESNLNTLKEKQIRNNLRGLKKIYPNLVLGGNGYGRGFKYLFHSSLFDLVTERKYKTNTPTYLNTRLNNVMKESEINRNKIIFFKSSWDYITGLTPSKDIEPSVLKEIIKDPNLNIFYSIHRNYETNSFGVDTNHIHWIFGVKNHGFDLIEYLKRLSNTEFKSIVDTPKPFDSNRQQNCYDYFSGNWYNNLRNQILIEFGTL